MRDAIAENRLRYPVGLDNDYGTWKLVEPVLAGQVPGRRPRPGPLLRTSARATTTRPSARSARCSREAGREPGAGTAEPVRAEQAAPGVTTPETYLGWGRAQGFAESARIQAGTQDFGTTPPAWTPTSSRSAGAGRSRASAPPASTGARIEANVGARRVFLVLGSPGRPRHVRVLLDGKPLPDRLAGPDVHGGIVDVGAQRLYRLVDLGRVERHVVSIVPDAGVEGYAFTFG